MTEDLTVRDAFEQNAITARALDWDENRAGTLSGGEYALYNIVGALTNGDFDRLDAEWKRAVVDALTAVTEQSEERTSAIRKRFGL